MDKQTCHFEGHLNSPITDDEVKFVLKYDKFYCPRHEKLKCLFETKFKGIKSYSEYSGCYWTLVEDTVSKCKFKVPQSEPEFSLRILAEAAVWNTKIHHESYYGIKMDLDSELDDYKSLLFDSKIQDLYKIKTRVEHIKSQITNIEQTSGEFHTVSDDLLIEKELSIVRVNGKFFLFPTTLIMCVLDNLQTRFYIRLHVMMKEKNERIEGLTRHYDTLHSTLIRMRGKYINGFFEIMKNWDAYCIGLTVSDEVEDLGFQTLKDSIEAELIEKFNKYDIRGLLDLMTCRRVSTRRDVAVPISLYFSNLSKNYGHPILHPTEGIEKLRLNSKKHIDVDDQIARKVLWMFRKTYFTNYFRKNSHYPKHKVLGDVHPILEECLKDERALTNNESKTLPLSAWSNVKLEKNHDMSLEIDEKELLKDTACSPPREEWFRPYDQCAFMNLYGQRKPRSWNHFESRVLARYLKGDEGELAKKIQDQENLYYNHLRDDIVQLCRKERELNIKGRVFCKQTYEMRLMQVCMEKSLSDNVLPYVKEQTMTNTELEVAKRMDKVASHIKEKGHANLNLDLSSWNQLNRHDLNKYLFQELDGLHGRQNLYSDSHLWFNRCMVLLSSRLTPPEIGPDGEPLAGDYCHYNQLGGFEGMRQKAWTLTTIMIIKIALEECNIQGEVMGQGDNQIIHIRLNTEQQSQPHFYIKMLLNSLDYLFRSAGLLLKLQETWYSQNLFEYSKVRYYKSIRIDDSLKRLNRMIPDINEGFPSLQSLITGVSTTTENMSRNYVSPIIPFFLYSLELGNTLKRKGAVDLKTRDTDKVCALMNIPSILGGLPLSNMYQHCQRGCPDPLTIWLKILEMIRKNSPKIYNRILHLIPCKVKSDYDPVKLVEDIYSLNIVGMPNFERKARELIEEFLPTYVTNPKVIRLLGADKSDLESLCSILTTMRPYVANLAHEILRNSNEGVQLQLIGSFSNLQTINRMINEDPNRTETIFSLGKFKDAEAIEVLNRRLTQSELPVSGIHLLERALSSIPCTFKAAQWLRETTWGFPIMGITSPVPCEQVKIEDYDNMERSAKRDCIIAKTSYKLKTCGKEALSSRGPFEPYLGTSTPEKMIRPKLTVINPNPQIKSVMKLYYILTYLERMDPTSPLIRLVNKMIQDKLKYLPPEFNQTPLSDWCGRNYGGSYEHRFKASSQKRSALFSLMENLATHVTINTNLLGKALRGNEDYNLFFQEIFLYIQNYVIERANQGLPIADTYAIPLNCPDCTYLILNTPISINLQHMSYQSKLIQSQMNSRLSKTNLTESIQICTLAMSVSVGRKLTASRMHDKDVHNALETFQSAKTEESTERTSSNLMSEFRNANFDYVLVGALQNSKQLVDFILGKSREYPVPIFEHLSYLIINSERMQEILGVLQVPIEKHSSVTQTSGLAKVLAKAVLDYIKSKKGLFFRACVFTTFASDLISKQAYLWRTFVGHLIQENSTLSTVQKRGILRTPQCGGSTVHEWCQRVPLDLTKNLSVDIKFEENDAISVWRDLKNEIGEHIESKFPLSSRLETIAETEGSHPSSIGVSDPLNDYFHFSFESLIENGSTESPIWVKWVHHCTRPIGKISTSASKIHQIMSHCALKGSGLIVTLAEGSGGILNYLAHLYPSSRLIYNTLQSDLVENKENVLNIIPPALVGDPCDPVKRICHIEDTCLGETDITKESFIRKLKEILQEEQESIAILSMDAELKTDMTNTDKLEIYLPLVKGYMTPKSLLINKMFINNSRSLENVRSCCHSYGYSCNFHKPSSSHPHNSEVYVVCFLQNSLHHTETQEPLDELHLFNWKLLGNGLQLLSTRTNRVNYLKNIVGQANNSLFTSLRSHPCIWAVRRKYQVEEISEQFLSKRHQRNLMMCLLAIERNSEVIDYREKSIVYIPFMRKEQIAALLVLSILTSLHRNFNQLVSILDSLSILSINCNIIPPKKLEVSLSLITGPETSSQSVLGVLDHKVKDYFRTLPYFKIPQDREVPAYTLNDGVTRIREAEQMRHELEENLKELVRESECGYTSYLNILRR
ncbi:uncharacterized protein LOC123722369 [Papilio machaon]|uniref:uncharacterized protein LOC123722369 n=1 Tax=Papilio machaon TaxID=76193 RepID=UPI001E665E6A|nr:uncharacterized protein LOC123722369 [Papilio machaon]